MTSPPPTLNPGPNGHSTPNGFVATPEQDAIIRYPLLPLRVAAGAGTGKTTTLAHRVRAAVLDHGLRPDQVLGVTFTNKAAHELADRFTTVLGDLLEPGHAVDVSTYHGFAASILLDHGVRLGLERAPAVITPTFARQLVIDALTEGEYRHLDLTNRTAVVTNSLKLASDLGDNLRTAADLLELPAETDVDHQRREYAQVVGAYESLKQSLSALDYADLIRRATELVNTFPDIASQIRAPYRLVLLDEYQDTNPAQRQLLATIFGDGFPVTAVGDAGQTIYEWRGASRDNFDRFPEHFPAADGTHAVTLPLSENRRSAKPILTLAGDVLPSGMPLSPTEDAPDGQVTVSWYRTARQEAEGIATEMRRLRDTEGLAWRDMAVLFRKNKDIALVRDALEDNGIPVQVANLGGLLHVPEVVETHAWLRVLARPTDTPALARILMGSKYRLGMFDMRHLADWIRTQRPDPTESDADRGPTHTLVEAVDHIDELGLSERAATALSGFATAFRSLLATAQTVSLVELVRRILEATDAWRDVQAMPAAAQLSARLNLYRFLDLAEEWSPLEGRPSLEAFLDYLELMADDPGEELDTARLADDDAATLLTVHRAKGLEWEAVFLPALYHNNFPSSSRTYENPYLRSWVLPNELRLDAHARVQMDPSMSEKEIRELLSERHVEQEWRLAYVAVTRAKRYLSLSGSYWHGAPQPNKRAVKPSAFLEVADAAADSARGTWVAEPGDRPEQLRFEGLAGAPDPYFAEGWDGALRHALADPGWGSTEATAGDVAAAYHAAVADFQDMLFSLPEPMDATPEPAPLRTSVTSLVTYATCPKRYFWSEVDRLPRRSSAAARRGVELHRRIELHNRGAIPMDELHDDLYDMAPAERSGPATGGDVDGDGSAAFTRFKESRFGTELPAFVETPFELRLPDGSWVRGRVDAIYDHGDGHWEVVDFKSGRPSRNPAVEVQLQAYAVAATEAGFGRRHPDELDVTFLYLGGGYEERTTRVDDTWLDGARTNLAELTAGINAGQFPEVTSGACQSCDFLRFCGPGKQHTRHGETPDATGG